MGLIGVNTSLSFELVSSFISVKIYTFVYSYFLSCSYLETDSYTMNDYLVYSLTIGIIFRCSDISSSFHSSPLGCGCTSRY